MRRLATLIALGWLPTLYAAPDPKAVGNACYEKYRSSGSFDEIQACIDKALVEGKVLQAPSPSPASPPTASTVASPSSRQSTPESNSASAPSSPSEFQALDQDASYAGRGCTYFTKPSLDTVDWDGNRKPGPGLYSDGSEVAYGKWLYRCVSKRWEVVNPTRIYSARQLEFKWAQVIERTGVAPKDPLP